MVTFKLSAINVARAWGGLGVSATYLIEGDLTERQIEADVAQYLGWCAEGMPFRLHDVNEQLTGADKLCDVAVPIYIQFKKSTGLRPLSIILPLKRRANESALQDIRRFRAKQELPDNPTLFFGLRKRAKGAVDLQHNILLEHNRPPASHAIYVAPLSLDRRAYFDELCDGPRFRDDPWSWQGSKIWHGWPIRTWISHFDRQPFLKGHISIAPHQRVEDHHHHYAYSIGGDSVSWHSPEVLERGPSRLSDFMSLRVRQLLSPGYDLPSVEQSLGVAMDLLREMDSPREQILGEGEPLEKLHSYGKWLWKKEEIRQFLLLARRKDLEEVRSLNS